MEKTNKERGYINSLNEVLKLDEENLEKIGEGEKVEMLVNLTKEIKEGNSQHFEYPYEEPDLTIPPYCEWECVVERNPEVVDD